MKKIISPDNGKILAVAREVGGVLHVTAGEELLNWSDWVNSKQASFSDLDGLVSDGYVAADFAAGGPETLVEFKQVQAVESFFRAAVEFEVKGVRAMWDPDLGPNGGWRCPPGTPAAGQWTNRFGTNCAVPGLGPKLGGRRGLISRLADIVDPDKPTPGGGQAGLVLMPPGKKPRKTGSKPKPGSLLEFLDGLKDRKFTPRRKPKQRKRKTGKDSGKSSTPLLDWLINLIDPDKPKRQRDNNNVKTPLLDFLIDIIDPNGEDYPGQNSPTTSAQGIVDDYFDDGNSSVPGAPGGSKPKTPKKPKPKTPPSKIPKFDVENQKELARLQNRRSTLEKRLGKLKGQILSNNDESKDYELKKEFNDVLEELIDTDSKIRAIRNANGELLGVLPVYPSPYKVDAPDGTPDTPDGTPNTPDAPSVPRVPTPELSDREQAEVDWKNARIDELVDTDSSSELDLMGSFLLDEQASLMENMLFAGWDEGPIFSFIKDLENRIKNDNLDENEKAYLRSVIEDAKRFGEIEEINAAIESGSLSYKRQVINKLLKKASQSVIDDFLDKFDAGWKKQIEDDLKDINDEPKVPNVPDQNIPEVPNPTINIDIPDINVPGDVQASSDESEAAEYIIDMASPKQLDDIGDYYYEKETEAWDTLTQWADDHNSTWDKKISNIGDLKTDLLDVIKNKPSAYEVNRAEATLKKLEELKLISPLTTELVFLDPADNDERRKILKKLATLNYKEFFDRFGGSWLDGEDDTPEPDVPSVTPPTVPAAPKTPDDAYFDSYTDSAIDGIVDFADAFDLAQYRLFISMEDLGLTSRLEAYGWSEDESEMSIGEFLKYAESQIGKDDGKLDSYFEQVIKDCKYYLDIQEYNATVGDSFSTNGTDQEKDAIKKVLKRGDKVKFLDQNSPGWKEDLQEDFDINSVWDEGDVGPDLTVRATPKVIDQIVDSPEEEDDRFDLTPDELDKIINFWPGYNPSDEIPSAATDEKWQEEIDPLVKPFDDLAAKAKKESGYTGSSFNGAEAEAYQIQLEVKLDLAEGLDAPAAVEIAKRQLEQFKNYRNLQTIAFYSGEGNNDPDIKARIEKAYKSLPVSVRKELRLRIDKNKDKNIVTSDDLDAVGVIKYGSLLETDNLEKVHNEISGQVSEVINNVSATVGGMDTTVFSNAIVKSIQSPSVTAAEDVMFAIDDLQKAYEDAYGPLGREKRLEFERLRAAAGLFATARYVATDSDNNIRQSLSLALSIDSNDVTQAQIDEARHAPFALALYELNNQYYSIPTAQGQAFTKFYLDASNKILDGQERNYGQTKTTDDGLIRKLSPLSPLNNLTDDDKKFLSAQTHNVARARQTDLAIALSQAGIISDYDIKDYTSSEIAAYVDAANMSTTITPDQQMAIAAAYEKYKIYERTGIYEVLEKEGFTFTDVMSQKQSALGYYDNLPQSEKNSIAAAVGVDISNEHLEELGLDVGDESDLWVDIPSTTIEDKIPDNEGTKVPDGPIDSSEIKAVVDGLETVDLDTLKTLNPHSEDGPWGPIPDGEKATYGVIYVDNDGKILVRQPLNLHDGYHWTFPKGTKDPGEVGVETAIREGLEETGITPDPVGFLPGGHKSGSSTTYFVIAKVADVEKLPTDEETQDLAWVTPAEALEKVKQSTNSLGRKRDIGILDAINKTFDSDDPASTKWMKQAPNDGGDSDAPSLVKDPIGSIDDIDADNAVNEQLTQLIGVGNTVTLKNPETGSELNVEIEEVDEFDASFDGAAASKYFADRLTTQTGKIDLSDDAYDAQYKSRLDEIEKRLKEVEEGRAKLPEPGSLAAIGAVSDGDVKKFNTLARKEFFRSQALDIADKKRQAQKIGESEVESLISSGEITDKNVTYKLNEMLEKATILEKERALLVQGISNDESVEDMAARFKSIREREIAISRINGRAAGLRYRFSETIKNEQKQITAHNTKHAATGFLPKNPQDLLNPPDKDGTARHLPVKGIASIDTPEKAAQHLLDGGSIDDISDALLRDAIMSDLQGGQKRFKIISGTDPGINGAEGSPTFMFKDTMNEGRIYILKRPVRNHDEHLSEAAAASLGSRLGLPMTGMRILGDPYEHTNTVQGSMFGQTTSNRAFLMEHSDNVVESGQAGSGLNGALLARAALLHYIIEEPDNHPSNRVTRYDANGRKYVVPFDHGKAFLDWNAAVAGHEHGGLSEIGGVGGTVLSLLQGDEQAGNDAIRELKRLQKILQDDPDFLTRDVDVMDGDIQDLTESERARIADISDRVRSKSKEFAGEVDGKDPIQDLIDKLPYEVQKTDAGVDISGTKTIGTAFSEHKGSKLEGRKFTISSYDEDDITDNQLFVQSSRKIQIDGNPETAALVQFRYRGVAIDETSDKVEGKARFDALHQQVVDDGWELVSNTLTLDGYNETINFDDPSIPLDGTITTKSSAPGRVYRKRLPNGDIALLYLDDDFVTGAGGSYSIPYGAQHSSAHGLIRIAVRGDESQIEAKMSDANIMKDTLSQVGVKSHGAPTPEHLDKVARLKLAGTLSRKQDPDEALAEIESIYGITPKDMQVSVNPHTGQIEYALSDEAVDRIMTHHNIPETAVTYHNISGGNGTPSGLIKMIEGGYLATLNRHTFGIGAGISAQQDIANGGGDFAYLYYLPTKPTGTNIYIPIRDYFKYTFEGMASSGGNDVWGNYWATGNTTNAVGVETNGYQFHRKGFLTPASGMRVTVYDKSTYNAVLKHFKDLGIDSIDGIPIEEIIAYVGFEALDTVDEGD